MGKVVAEIFLDGEAVRFEGTLPASLHELLALIEHSLAETGRVMAAVTIDGRAVEAGVDAAAYAAARRIEIASVSVADAVAQVAAACARSAGELRAPALALCESVLREPWPDAAPKLAALGGRLGDLFRELGSLGHVPNYAALTGEFGAALERWMDAFAARDAAGVCLCFDTMLIPLLDRLAGPPPATAR